MNGVAGWRPTAALVRATAAAAVIGLAAVGLGRPDLLVLALPLGLHAALALALAPRDRPAPRVELAHTWLHEGQATRLRLHLDAAAGAEQVTSVLVPPPHVAVQPATGVVTATPPRDGPLRLEHAVSPRRWGRRSSGRLRLAATSRWAGFRWGPALLPERWLTALPQTAAFGASQDPHPVGMVGQHRSRRPGDGSELVAIRPFQPGDRLRRIEWRTSLRTGQLHAVGTDAQQDSSVLLLLDAVVDVGASRGLDGSASSLDVAVRAAAALAGHHARLGDRVSLRVLGREPLVLAPGTGHSHHRRLLGLLAQVEPGWPQQLGTRQTRFRTVAGTVVVVLSPMLTAEITTAVVTLARRGLSVVVVDTLPDGVLPDTALEPLSPGRLAWRMRMVERGLQATELARRGVPVVAWRGPGTLDEVLRRLARRGRLPREVTR